MFTCCKLAMLMLVLTLDGQASAGKIVGGHEAAAHSRPYMMLIERYNETSKKPEYCGGFLLNEDFVMTAAHCIAETYKIYLGLHDFSKDQNTAQKILVEQAFPHSGYHPGSLIHDVMLLKLRSKAKFSDTVKPIPIATQDDPLPTCQIAGWGQTSRPGKHMSFTLMEANVTLIDNENCKLENAYCSEGDIGPGKGDSGGPLVCNGNAYGVVSSTLTPNSGPLIHRFTKIPDYGKWITLTIMKALKSS